MANKKIKRKAVKKLRKAFTGLKNYVILALLAAAGIGLVVLYLAWNSARLNLENPVYGVVNLPQTGEVTYYANCLISAPNGLGNYEYGSEVRCSYRGSSQGGYDYETSQMYLKCEVNDVIKKNNCLEGIVK